VASQDRFKQAVITVLAKRAASRCSNPDCGAITSGPSKKRLAAVNVGEAAHIFGAHPGSARYDPGMASAERADLTNAIWLCSNCHKLIDDDPLRYPTGLLFEWQREHERMISEQVGKAGAELRQRYERRHLEELGKLSYLAERIILTKDNFWEYKLTSEVLRYEMAPLLQRWNALSRGLYVKLHYTVSKDEFSSWTQSRLAEVQQITGAFSELMNVEFQRAWGEPGIAGDDALIVTTCRLFAGMCASAIEWEEAVRFAQVPSVFEEVRTLYVGIAGSLIEEAAKVPSYMGTIFASDPQPGTYRLELTLTLPDDWPEAVSAALERAVDTLIAESRS
jgi:hypothetical protein